MSWSLFLDLLAGLSPRSRYAMAVQKESKRVRFATQAEAQAYAASGYGFGGSK